MPENPESPREIGYYMALAQVGLEMVAPIGVGIAIDYYFDSMPWATVSGAAVGFIGGMLHLILMVREHDKEEGQGPPRGAS